MRPHLKHIWQFYGFDISDFSKGIQKAKFICHCGLTKIVSVSIETDAEAR